MRGRKGMGGNGIYGIGWKGKGKEWEGMGSMEMIEWRVKRMGENAMDEIGWKWKRWERMHG